MKKLLIRAVYTSITVQWGNKIFANASEREVSLPLATYFHWLHFSAKRSIILHIHCTIVGFAIFRKLRNFVFSVTLVCRAFHLSITYSVMLFKDIWICRVWSVILVLCTFHRSISFSFLEDIGTGGGGSFCIKKFP